MYKFPTLILLGLALALPAAAQESKIYKTVDEDGNVVYTDRKPSDDAEPMTLPELTVADPPVERPRMAAEPRPARGPDIQLAFESPQPEEHIQGTENNTLTVRLNSSVDMPGSARIVLYLDGQKQSEIPSLATTIPGIPRGEHTIRAEMVTAGGRVLASTEPVVFYMRQHSRLHPSPP